MLMRLKDLVNTHTHIHTLSILGMWNRYAHIDFYPTMNTATQRIKSASCHKHRFKACT